MTQWKNIESAPRDGTAFLAIIAGKHPKTGVPFIANIVEYNAAHQLFVEPDFAPEEDEEYLIRGAEQYSDALTHWQPLPPSPLNRALEE